MLNIDNSMASDFFAVRNLDENTKKTIKKYAAEHNLNLATAIQELIKFGINYAAEYKPKKKYNSFFDFYDKVKFNGGPNLTEEIDEIVYGVKRPK